MSSPVDKKDHDTHLYDDAATSPTHSNDIHDGKNRRDISDDEFGGPEERARLEKKLLRKIDLRMLILVFIYILNYVDRNNASAARLRGLEADLHLTGQQFPTLLSILYVGYIIMQIPSNMFLNYIGKPSIYLPVCMMIWGMVSILTGITRNFVGALLTRFFLGFVEAAFFPGALFLLSKWYKRDELGLRTAILYCGNLASNAFGNLLAAGILDGMQGKLGRVAWRWLFYIEGSLTIFVAFLAIFILPDFPHTTTWLTPQERRLAEARMAEDVGEVDEDHSIVSDRTDRTGGTTGGDAKARQGKRIGTGQFSGFIMAISDWKVWWLAFALTAQVIGLSFNAYFPTLTATLGYSRNVTLLLCAPPWGFATIVAFINARHADKTGERFLHISVPLTVGMLGFVIALSTRNIAARYIALFLMAQSYAGFIVFYSWISNSIPRPPAKRAVALALINAFSQLGNIAGSYVWPSTWGPTYRKSYGITLSNFALGIVMTFIFSLHLKHLNKRLDRGELINGIQGVEVDEETVRDAAQLEGITIEEALKRRKGFRYLY